MDMHIRIAEPGDGAAIAAIYAPYVSDTAITFELEPPPAEEMARRIAAVLPTHPWLVAVMGERIAGYVYAGRFSARAAYDWSAEITAYLDPDFHRRGIGQRLYAALIGLLREQGYHALYGGITLPNDASVGLHRAIGMTEVGVYREAGFKAGRWHDVGWFGMTISPTMPPTSVPLAFAELRARRPEFVEDMLA